MTTQNCPECGTRAEPGQAFCDACGAVLSWTEPARAGSRAGEEQRHADGSTRNPTTAPAAGPGGAPAAATGTPGTTAQRPAAAPAPSGPPGPAAPGGTGVAGAMPPGAGSPAAGPTGGAAYQGSGHAAASGADAGSTPGYGSGQGPGAASGDTAPTEPVPAADSPEAVDAAARARSLLVPVADPEERVAATPSVAPVLPGRPEAERPQTRVPGPQESIENGPPCPWCATPNRPDRHFCARCAMPMAGENRATSERRPWWRRMLDFRNRATPWAGDRPRMRRTFDRIVTWVVAAVLVAGAIYAGVKAPSAVQAIRDHFAKRAPVVPDGFSASHSWTGHKPHLAFDTYNNTWWGPGVSQAGTGEWIEARFNEPTRLLNLVITPGVSTHADQLSEEALPHRVKATITMKDGKTVDQELILDQGAGDQTRAFRFGDVTKVRFTVESAYATSEKKQVAIAEIEFFGPSNAGAS